MTKKNHIGTIGTELDTIPDLIEPRIAWRAWYLEPHAPSGGDLVLRAYFKEEAFWLPGGAERKPMVAECHSGRPHEDTTKAVPVEGCQCGLYASSDPKWTLNYAISGLRDRVLHMFVNSITPEDLKDVDYTRFSSSMTVLEAVEILTDLCRKRGDIETAVAIENKRLPYGYAADWPNRPWFSQNEGRPPQAVFGTVNMWGKVIPHDTGYRSSHAYPREMFLSRLHYADTAEAVQADLMDRYGVPVTIVDDWPDVIAQHEALEAK